MKKKILLAIVAVLSFCSFAAGLTACAKKEHEHNYEATVVAPTCTELGYTVHTCNECQHSYVDTYVVVLGHSYTNYVSNGNATCTQDGTKTAVCDRDGCNERNTVTDEGTKFGHALGTPVWTWTGYESATATSTCANDASHVESVTATISSVVTTPATCTADGVRTYTATVTLGGETYTDEKNETLTKLGHDFAVEWSWTDYTSATATFTCANDGTHVENVTATGEAITSVVTTPATCTADGVRTYTATVSFGGKTYTSTKDETLTMLGHSYGEPKWSWEGYTKAKITFTCSHDNSHVMTGTVTGGAITSAVTTPATCTENGVRTYTAKITSGGKTYTSTKDETLTMLGHSYTAEWTWTGYTSATATLTCANDKTLVTETATGEAITSAVTTPATCMKDGERTYTATITVDGVEYKGTATESVAATGHTWADNVCTVCKSDAGGSKGLNMVLNEETNTYSLDGIGDCKDTQIVIPAIYNGKPVTAIGASAFNNCSDITRVTFDANSQLTSIGDSAFNGCSRLNSITIPASVTSIGNSAFNGCNNLNSITIPASVTSIGASAFNGCSFITSVTFGENIQLTSIGESTFNGCRRLTSVAIPDSVESIGASAFNGCEGLQSLTFGENSKLKSIGNYAFYYCSSLESVIIPASVESIGDNVFEECSKLASVTISDSVTSIGKSAFYKCESLTSVTFGENSKLKSIGNFAFYYCSKLASVTIPDSVESIGSSAFASCDALTSIIIPASVTSIGEKAFNACTGLESVTFGANSQLTTIGNYAFQKCFKLTSITIPASVESIGNYAFYECSKLTSLTIAASVKSFGEKAFYNCTALTVINYNATQCADLSSDNNVFSYAGQDGTGITVKIGANVKKIPAYLFYPYNASSYTPEITSVVFEEGSVCESIGNYVFYNCDSLTSITIPNSVTSIGNNAFEECSSLTSITIPASVTSIGNSAFEYCRGLTSVTFGDNSQLTSIGNSAFNVCIGLTSIIIPDSVKSIGERAFNECYELTSITIPASVESIGNYAFVGCNGLESITVDENNKSYKSIDGNLYTIDGKTLIKYGAGKTETSFVIPADVTSISDYAFLNCRSLTSVTIPDGVTSIGNQAFNNCSSLTSITIPASVTSIGDYAFYYCSKLKSITIPASVTSIGKQAFDGCTALTSVYYKGTAEAWSRIKISTGNDILTSATIYYYSATEPALNAEGTAYVGNFWHYVDGEIVVWVKETV